MEKFSWARLTACSLGAAKFWLRFIADVWMDATHGSEEVEEVFQTVIDAVEVMEGKTYSDPAEAEVQGLYEVFKGLADALESLDNNPVNVGCQLGEKVSKKLRLGWYGAWTSGRYLEVSYEPKNWPTVFVEWDTATGEESTFLSLPSTAEQFVEDDSEANVCPVVNQYRIACQSIGIDVGNIPERGHEGVERAQQALKNLVESAVREAEEKVRKGGAVTAD